MRSGEDVVVVSVSRDGRGVQNWLCVASVELAGVKVDRPTLQASQAQYGVTALLEAEDTTCRAQASPQLLLDQGNFVTLAQATLRSYDC